MIQNTLKTRNITEELFERYILFDRKLTTNKPALYALKSRFKTIKRYFDNKPFNRDTFTDFLASEKKRGISDTTLNKLISCAKHIAQMIGQDDLKDYSYFREKKKDVETLTWSEMKALAEVQLPYRLSKEGITCEEQNLRMWCYITLMSEVGCRKSEALKLLWKDVKSNSVTFRDTKNGDDRTVPITPLLSEKINKLSHLSETVFNLSDLSNQVILDLKKRADVAGIKKPIYNHVIRHSVATYLLSSKAPLKLVCNILGWKDPKTADRYDQSGLTEMEELLSTYSRIFKEHMDFETVVDKIKSFIENIVDHENMVLHISQTCDTMEIRIRKCK